MKLYWHVKAFIYKAIGDCIFSLNGGLDGLDRDNLRARLMIKAWSAGWFAYEKADGRI